MKKNRCVLECPMCHANFEVIVSQVQHRKTCGTDACKKKWRSEKMQGNKYAVGNKPNRTAFKAGDRAWNAGIRGTHFSPETEFKKGQISKNQYPLGSIRIRTDKQGKPRAWVKTSEPNVWKLRAVIVWESHAGSIPKGFIIHHGDRNSLNDVITNLSLMSRAAHMLEHRAEFESRRVAALEQSAQKRREARQLVSS
jgi:hypothetical protein